MKLFRDFLKGFKPKYRVAHDRSLHLRTRVFASPEDAEVLLYESYLRRMRQTGDTNLNLDMGNLLAYPPSKKLYGQLSKYPQEVVPAMDQVLKDLMLETADADQREGLEGMSGVQGDEEIADIMGRIYKVRPFGLKAVNMRELNPTGPYSLVYYLRVLTSHRHRQTSLNQRPRNPRDARHPRHESRLLQVPDLFPHSPRRNRPRQNRGARPLPARRVRVRRNHVTRAQ